MIVGIDLGTRQTFSAEDLSALVLRDLKASAETYLDANVEEAVISVSAYFNEHQQQWSRLAVLKTVQKSQST